MKKIISLILAVIMIATLGSVLVTAVAADDAAAEAYLFRNGALCDLEPYTFADACMLAAMDTFAVEGETSTYTIKLIKNVAATGSFQFNKAGVNIVIDGELADGSCATLALTPVSSNANSLRFEAEANYVLKSLKITGSNTNGCLIQVKTKAALDVIDCDISTTQERYYTINCMRDDGGKTYVNIIRSKLTQLNPQTSEQLGNDGNKYPYINQRGIIGTCNAKGMDHHLVLNIVDSTLASQSACIFINAGSTADIDVKNSTLERLACDIAVNYGGKSSSTAGKYYLPGYADDTLNAACAVQLDPVSNLKAESLRDGTYNTITFDAVDTLIKYPAGGEAIHQIVGYTGIDYSVADPWTLTNQTSAPDVKNMPIDDAKTAELRAASKVTVNYAVGEPDANVKSDLTALNLFACPVVQVPTAEETTTAGETTTATPGGNTTTEPETTTDDPEGDGTTAPADDQTTAPADDQTTAPAGDDVTTAGDDAAAGGCAGCNDAGAGAAIALAVAMAAAVAIIVKKK